jgi:hypothetical protein
MGTSFIKVFIVVIFTNLACGSIWKYMNFGKVEMDFKKMSPEYKNMSCDFQKDK